MKDNPVLLVDDNPDDVKLTLKAFQKWGVSNQVDVASDGVAALEYLSGSGTFAGRNPSFLPVVILLDLKMPRLNGIEVLQRIRVDEKTKGVPVVILTTSNEEKDRAECYALGANSYIRKPVKFSQFGDVMQQLLPWLTLDTSQLEKHQGPILNANVSGAPDMVRMRLRVLIVEDSENDTKLLVRALAKAGFEVTSRQVDTAEAMQAALDEEAWDLILTDHTMPEFNALAALDTLKKSSLDLPFIIVSGLIGEEVAVEAMRAGAHDYIMKGNLARLVPAIERELREAIVRRERRQADEALHLAYAELERRVEERTAELARVNEELRLHQEREVAALKEMDRQKDEFLSVAAHELKTPVTSLLGFAQILLQHYEKQRDIDPERMSRALGTIVRQAHKLTALVSQLLDVSRIEGGRLTLECQHVDLVRIVGDVAAATRLRACHHEITFQAPPSVEAFVDPLRIEQVVTNLVNNAIQYSTDGPVEIGLAAGDGAIEITVRDHGIGIPPEHLPHIFERFYQAHKGRHVAGLGLGLFISSQIVALHGGRIQVECLPDGGSRFTVVLPIGVSGPELGAPGLTSSNGCQQPAGDDIIH